MNGIKLKIGHCWRIEFFTNFGVHVPKWIQRETFPRNDKMVLNMLVQESWIKTIIDKKPYWDSLWVIILTYRCKFRSDIDKPAYGEIISAVIVGFRVYDAVFVVLVELSRRLLFLLHIFFASQLNKNFSFKYSVISIFSLKFKTRKRLTFAIWSWTTHMMMVENVISMSVEPNQVSAFPFELTEFVKASSSSNQKQKQLHYLKICYFISMACPSILILE